MIEHNSNQCTLCIYRTAAVSPAEQVDSADLFESYMNHVIAWRQDQRVSQLSLSMALGYY